MRTTSSLLLLALATACRPAPSETDDEAASRGALLGVGLTPNNPSLSVGETLQFRAEAFYENTSTEVITEVVAWIVDDDRVASVSDAGEAEALSAGTTSVVAQYEGLSAQVQLTVRAASQAVEQIDLTPNPLTLTVGTTAALMAMATYTDGTSGNVAATCTWSSDDPAIATVDALGVVSGIARGQATVSADCAGIESEVSVTVAAAGTGSPDLRIQSATHTVSGTTVEYTLVIENRGDAATSAFQVAAFLNRSGAPTDGTGATTSGTVTALAPGAETTVRLTARDVASGSHSSWFLADSGGAVTESNETNNASGPLAVTLASTPTTADLTVLSFEGLADTTASLWFVTVKNTGDAVATNFWIDLFYDANDVPEPGDIGDDFIRIDKLEPGKTYTWEPEASYSPAAGVTWDSIVFVDSTDVVEESDESDNIELIELERL